MERIISCSSNKSEEACSSLEKAFKEVGSENSRLIKDELLWLDVYSALLADKSILLRSRKDFGGASKVLKEGERLSKQLFERYKDKIINVWGEERYYKYKSLIMDRFGSLTFDGAESEDDLRKVQEYEKNYIIYALKAEDKQSVALGRANLATLQMLLAKSQDGFKKVYEKVEGTNLEDCIEVFEEIGDKYHEAIARNRMAICYLALKLDDDAIKFAKDSVEIVKKGPDEISKACYELALAYIKMTSNLSDFKKKELSDEVYELIQNAYEKFEKKGLIDRFIALTVKAIAKYLRNEINFEELLKELDNLAKELELREGRGIIQWIVKQLINTIKEKGDIDEDFLRLEGVKLLLIL